MVYNKIYAQIGEERHITLEPINYQYDVKQILVLTGETVPDYYEADVCNVGDTATLTMVGTEADGVEIPDKFLLDGRNVLVYIVIPGSGGDVQTRYDITIPVDERAEREDIDPSEAEQKQIDSLINALNSGVGRAETAATAAEESATDAEGSAGEAEDQAKNAEAWAVGKRAGTDVETEDPTYHNNSKYYAGMAEAAAGRAEEAAELLTDVSATATTLELGQAATAEYSDGVFEFGIPKGPKGDPLTYDDLTEAQKAELVQGPILEAQTSAVTAVGRARTSAVNAVNQAGTTQTGAVNQAGENQVAAVNQAGANQTAAAKAQADAAARSAAEALQSKNDAAQAKTDAEAAKRAAVAAKDTAVDAAGTATQAKNDAEAASEAVQNLSVSATTLAAGSPASVQKTVDPQTGAVNLAFGIPQGLPGEGLNTYHYGARWNKTTHAMERTGSAAQITTTLTNFAHRGSINANYNNPFDNIYPWSGCKLCNIDLEAYRALASGQSVRDCIIAWEGDPNFSYTHENGVWKYRPEFYGTSYDGGDGYRYFDITDKPLAGYVHYPEDVVGRWRGVQETRQIDGADKIILLPKPGMPCKRVAMSTIHTYAKNWGATLDNIFCLDGSILMFIIEYADFNCQSALGDGVSAMYRESSDHFTADATDSNQVRIANSVAGAVIVGSIIDIGTSNGGVQVGSYYVTAFEVDGTDKVLTLNEAVTVTTANFWSLHGRINIADEDIGSMSGYIGTNGQADCYYRGEVFWGNIWNYVLGAYHQANTNHVWLAKNADEADNYDAINTANHIDTGVALSASGGYIKELGFLSYSSVLSVPIFCTVVGGSSTDPVGDYYYVAVGSNTVLLFGGGAISGPYAGFYADWAGTAGASGWYIGGRPHLKSP